MKFLHIVASFFLNACATIHPQTVDDFQKTSVKIESIEGGGGSGVIYKSSDKGTFVLTNGHVCEAIVSGGIIYYDKPYNIVSYKISHIHDICYIFISENLYVNTVLSKTAPPRNSKITISGHPSLLPHIVSTGFVSGNEDGSIHVGDRACTAAEEKEDPLTCILDGHPITITRELTVVSALISPGSSGSGVFSAKGELVGLAFAAHGDLGYAMTVPWKYLNEFVKHESKKLKWQKPDPTYKRSRYQNKGLYDLQNWQEILKLINERNQCLRLCP